MAKLTFARGRFNRKVFTSSNSFLNRPVNACSCVASTVNPDCRRDLVLFPRVGTNNVSMQRKVFQDKLPNSNLKISTLILTIARAIVAGILDSAVIDYKNLFSSKSSLQSSDTVIEEISWNVSRRGVM